MQTTNFYAMWKDRGINKVLWEHEMGSDNSDLVVLGFGFRAEKVRTGDANFEGWVEFSGKNVWGGAFLAEGSIWENGLGNLIYSFQISNPSFAQWAGGTR